MTLLNSTNDLSVWLQDKSHFFADLPWLQAIQKSKREESLQQGLPNRKDERWKYTDVAFLEKLTLDRTPIELDPSIKAFVEEKRLQETESYSMVFVNGVFEPTLSDNADLPEAIICCSLNEALAKHTDLVKPYLSQVAHTQKTVFADINAALMTDGLFLFVPKNAVCDRPIHMLYVQTAQHHFSSPRNIIVLEPFANAMILEEHVSVAPLSYFTNVVTELHLQTQSQLQFYKIQTESLQATHIAEWFIQQARDSVIQTFSLGLGARLARETIWVNLNENNAACHVKGFSAQHTDNQHIDNHLQIDHIAPHCVSEMVYKGVLDGKTHGVFNGKIFVHKDAQKTLSRQANHNLLLSSQAEMDTKPEFEIYADDVKCSHGDTVGQLNQESLFYLRARGIPHLDALKMLTRAFAEDTLDTVKHPAILQRMHTLLNEALTHDE